MSSLRERIDLLENDLKAVPPRISVYHDLPFAILRYDPAEEWDLRREVKLLATRLEATGKNVHQIPMSEFLWKAIDETEGLEEVIGLERSRGYSAAQDQVTTYLSDREWLPLAKLLEERLKELNPAKDIAFLTRVAAMAPGIYHMSKLLDLMQRKTGVTTILFYPGSIEGTTGLLFMNLKDRDALGNYRVKIYG
ncbi:MAG: BREX protein BrxB domain-containing protein [Fimbriiglobus sp.]